MALAANRILALAGGKNGVGCWRTICSATVFFETTRCRVDILGAETMRASTADFCRTTFISVVSGIFPVDSEEAAGAGDSSGGSAAPASGSSTSTAAARPPRFHIAWRAPPLPSRSNAPTGFPRSEAVSPRPAALGEDGAGVAAGFASARAGRGGVLKPFSLIAAVPLLTSCRERCESLGGSAIWRTRSCHSRQQLRWFRAGGGCAAATARRRELLAHRSRNRWEVAAARRLLLPSRIMAAAAASQTAMVCAHSSGGGRIRDLFACVHVHAERGQPPRHHAAATSSPCVAALRHHGMVQPVKVHPPCSQVKMITNY